MAHQHNATWLWEVRERAEVFIDRVIEINERYGMGTCDAARREQVIDAEVQRVVDLLDAATMTHAPLVAGSNVESEPTARDNYPYLSHLETFLAGSGQEHEYTRVLDEVDRLHTHVTLVEDAFHAAIAEASRLIDVVHDEIERDRWLRRLEGLQTVVKGSSGATP